MLKTRILHWHQGTKGLVWGVKKSSVWLWVCTRLCVHFLIGAYCTDIKYIFLSDETAWCVSCSGWMSNISLQSHYKLVCQCELPLKWSFSIYLLEDSCTWFCCIFEQRRARVGCFRVELLHVLAIPDLQGRILSLGELFPSPYWWASSWICGYFVLIPRSVSTGPTGAQWKHSLLCSTGVVSRTIYAILLEAGGSKVFFIFTGSEACERRKTSRGNPSNKHWL